jgi:isoquinoline 1-oxidoreductase beta subunit
MKMSKTEQTAGLSRRLFLSAAGALGGSLVLGFYLPQRAEASTREIWYRDATIPELNAWIVISPDDTVTLRMGQTELGQGVWTMCAMELAEELACDWTKIRAEYASPNRNEREQAPVWTLLGKGVTGTYEDHLDDPNIPGGRILADGDARYAHVDWKGVYRRQMTNAGNSLTTQYYLQQAGAEARERLILAAADRLGVPAGELTAKDSLITHGPSGMTLRFGEVAMAAAATPHPDPASIPLKTPDQWTVLGTDRHQIDAADKVTGTTMYGSDVRLPGMLYAAAKACPVWGGGVKSYDEASILSRPGVQAVVPFDMPDLVTTRNRSFSGGVAVVADTWWHAKQALDLLPIEWDIPAESAARSSASIRDALIASLDEPGDVQSEFGDFDAAMQRAVTVVEATYTTPYRGRCRTEANNATVLVTDNRVDIWVGDQSPQETQFSASHITGLPMEQIYLHLTHMGGGYGRNGNGPSAEQAIMIAKAVPGRPVQMRWTREEDWNVGTTFGGQTIGRFRAGLDADGWPIAFEVRAAADTGTAGISWPDEYYFPNFRFSRRFTKFHVPVAIRRNDFPLYVLFRESFIDELAAAAGRDPLDYRRELVARGDASFNPRREEMLHSLDKVAELSGWGSQLPDGTRRGIAMYEDHAQVTTVSVSKRGKVTVDRTDIVYDAGFGYNNPIGAIKQMEGGIAWGIDDVLGHEFIVRDGQMIPQNNNTILRYHMAEYPLEVNVGTFNSHHWAHGPEHTMNSIQPAIANAVFQITGKRVRDFPLKNHDLSWG